MRQQARTFAAPALKPSERTIVNVMSRVPLDQILALPTAERVEIVQQIWDSVSHDAEGLPLTTAQREELERRWEAFQQNPEEGEPWEDVRKSLFGR